MADIFDAFKNTFRSDDQLTEYKKEDSNEGSLFKTAAIGAAVVGATLFGLGRTGALRYLSSEAHLIGKSLSETGSILNNDAPMLSRLLDNSPRTLLKQARNTFKGSLAENRSAMGELYNGKTYAEQYAGRMVEETEGIGRLYQKNSINSTIISHFDEDIKDKDVLKQVGQYVGNTYNSEIKTTEELSKELEDQFNLSHELSQRVSSFAEKVTDNISQDKSKTPVDKDKLRKIAIDEMQHKLKTTDDVGDSLLTGYKRATIEDLLKAEKEDRVKIGQKQKDFLQEVVDTATNANGDKIGNKILADRNVYKDKDGKLIDMRTVPNAVREFGEATADSIPAKIFHFRDLLYNKDTRLIEFFGQGTVAPNISHLTNKDASPFLDKAILHVGSHIYDAETLDKLSNHSYMLRSSQYGTLPRLAKSMYGLSTNRVRDKAFGLIDSKSDGLISKIYDFLDIGHQEESSNFEDMKGMFTKAKNPDWDRNVINRALKGEGKKDDYDKISSFMAQHTGPLSNRTWDKTIKSVQNASSSIGRYDLNELHMRNKDEIENAVNYFASRSQDNVLKNKRLDWVIKQYQRDPQGFLNRNISVSNKIPLQILESKTKITGHEILKREIQKEIMLSTDGIDYSEYFKALKDKGHITNSEYKDAAQLMTFAKFDNIYFKTKTIDGQKRMETVKELNHMFTSSVGDIFSINKLKNKYANVWQSIAFSSGERDKINTKFMSFRSDSKVFFGLNKKSAQNTLKTIRGINDATSAKAAGRELGNHVFNVYKELNGGKNRPDDVTSATMAGYFFAERLNTHFSKLGLGLSDKSMGSTAQTLSSYMVKRIFPTMLGLGALNYIDYRTEKYTGTGIYSKAASAYENTQVGMQKIFDVTGLGKLYKHLYKLSPQLQYIDEKGPMDAGQKKDYYENGYTPIRSGRFWGSLSSTPWAGTTIEYFKPTETRMIKSNYKFTSSLYGSKDEYWAHSWMPTPSHPLAPIRHFVTDRYHWENKHEKDRPYPMSAPLFDSGTPWGALLNPTLGKIIKPIRRYHQGEVDRATSTSIIGKLNREIHSRSQSEIDKKVGPTTYDMAVSDAVNGLIPYRFVPDVLADPKSVILQYKYNKNKVAKSNTNIGIGTGTRNSTSQEAGYSIDGSKSSGYLGASDGNVNLNAGNAGSDIQYLSSGNSGSFSPNVASINKRTQSRAKWMKPKNNTVQSRAAGQGAIAPAAKSVSGTMLNASIYRSNSVNSMDKSDLSDLMQTGSLKDTIGDMTFSAKEITGIWGFFYDTATDGGAPKARRLANAGSMTSNRRSFWDQNLGGLGDSLSEVGRRFLPRFGKEAGDFNPIRNTMPTWMPAKNRIGDPYVKYKQGEARLPGGGYEALNKLHPDAYGRYGAFDRFKILADIAPYSDEYKTWKHVAEQTVTDQALKDQMKQVKQRVSAQKDQHRFFSYKFKYSEMESKTITVAEIIDKNTFTSRELPGTPIKMAGVSFTGVGKDITSVLHEGQVVRMDIAKDPVRRLNKDTYRTLDAVLYSKDKTNLNLQSLKSGLSDERKDDTPAGVHAQFTGTSIGLGKLFENIAHNDTIPVLSMFNAKYFRTRSPLEEYERTEIWGKPYGSWQHPIRSYLIPSFERAWSKGMIGGIIKGSSVGFGLGIATLGGLKGRSKVMSIAGGIIGGLGGLKTTLMRSVGSEYIPERVKKRREIEEYFDNLKYIKYKRLYEKAKGLAWKYEKVNIEVETKKIKLANSQAKKQKSLLKSQKSKLHMFGMNGGGDQQGLDDKKHYVNSQINEATPQKTSRKIGHITMAALMYKEQMESTMRGMPTDAPWITMVSALSRRERPYFTEFVTAPQEERAKILKLVPTVEAEMLKRVWGQSDETKHPILNFIRAHGDKEANWFMSKVLNTIKTHTVDVAAVHKKVSTEIELQNYFSKHAKPGKKWAGWNPDVNMEETEVKVLNHEGIDVADSGYTSNNLKEARHDSPPAFDIYKHSNQITSHISDILGKSGLSNVRIVAIPTQQSGVSIRMDMMQDNINNLGNAIQNALS